MEERREWQVCLDPEQLDEDHAAAGDGQVEPVVGGDGGVETGEAAEDDQL